MLLVEAAPAYCHLAYHNGFAENDISIGLSVYTSKESYSIYHFVCFEEKLCREDKDALNWLQPPPLLRRNDCVSCFRCN